MSSVITVGELLERAELEVTAVAGQVGVDRIVSVPRIQKPGLALTGWPEQLHDRRVLVLGGTEIEYLGGHVVARGAGIIGHHMEIRGLGIINVKDLFGISAVRDTKKIELVVELREWNEGEEYDRLGFDDRFDRILDVAVPAVQLPVRPG